MFEHRRLHTRHSNVIKFDFSIEKVANRALARIVFVQGKQYRVSAGRQQAHRRAEGLAVVLASRVQNAAFLFPYNINFIFFKAQIGKDATAVRRKGIRDVLENVWSSVRCL